MGERRFFQTMFLVGKSHSIESTAMRKKLLKYNCCIIHSKNCFVYSDIFLSSKQQEHAGEGLDNFVFVIFCEILQRAFNPHKRSL